MAGYSEQVVAQDPFGGSPEYNRRLSAAPRLSMPSAHSQQAADKLGQLARAVELEVVPRLILARRGTLSATSAPVPGGPGLRADQVVEAARLSLAGDLGAMTSYVDALHAKGIPAETLYLQLLAPAAQHLGELWTADLCSFAEVTLGMMRLQQVMRELSPAFQSEGVAPHCEHQILLTPVPGEQHSFGLFMVAEFFHRAGWHVWTGPLASIDDLADVVRGQRFAIVGLSVSSDAKLDELSAAIRSVRRASMNQRVGLMVGGQMFGAHPEMAPVVGADATAKDSHHAVLQAQSLLDLGTGCD